MSTRIESFYQMRKKYRGAHVLGLSIFFLAWIARSVYKIAEAEIESLYLVILIVLLLSLVYLAYYAIRFNLVERKIKADKSAIIKPLKPQVVKGGCEMGSKKKILFLSCMVAFLFITTTVFADAPVPPEEEALPAELLLCYYPFFLPSSCL